MLPDVVEVGVGVMNRVHRHGLADRVQVMIDNVWEKLEKEPVIRRLHCDLMMMMVLKQFGDSSTVLLEWKMFADGLIVLQDSQTIVGSLVVLRDSADPGDRLDV